MEFVFSTCGQRSVQEELTIHTAGDRKEFERDPQFTQLAVGKGTLLARGTGTETGAGKACSKQRNSI